MRRTTSPRAIMKLWERTSRGCHARRRSKGERMATSEHHVTAAHSSEHVDAGCPQADAAEAPRHGPPGRLTIRAVTVRMIAHQYMFTPECVTVPVGTLVRFRLTSPDVTHGFIIADTNANAMIVPGFVSEIATRFDQIGEYKMPCHEFCGFGHHGMW